MNTLTISKDDILTAIETEPLLTTGAFIRAPRLLPCSTCAVGGVLRQRGLPYDSIDAVGFRVTENRQTFGQTAKEGNWLSALSIVWEALNVLNPANNPNDLRWDIWEWADANIPDEWEYELAVPEYVVTLQEEETEG